MISKDPANLSAIASELYSGCRSPMRQMLTLRPYICPFGPLMEHVPADSTVLDIGCGGGLFPALLIYFGAARKCVGVDASEKAIKAANDMVRNQQNGQKLTFIQQTLSQNWPLGQFDAITMIDVMHHIPRHLREDTIENIGRHLNKGGRFIYKDIAPSPRWKKLMNTLHDLVVAQDLPRYQSPDELARWCGCNSLKLVHREKIGMVWYEHEILVFEK